MTILVEQNPVSHSLVTDWLAQVLTEVHAPEEIAYGKVPRGDDVGSGRKESRHHHGRRRRHPAEKDALNAFFGHHESRYGI